VKQCGNTLPHQRKISATIKIILALLAYLYLISYLCNMEEIKKDSDLRELYFSDEFLEFYNKQSNNVRRKFDYVISIVKTEKVITTKFVKHLENTDLYEMRVSVSANEYRTVLFAIDNDNIISARKILVLNAFLKKSTKDYKRQIEIAIKILGGKRNETL